MDEELVAFDRDQRPAREPVQQLIAVGSLEHRRERVLAVRLRVARGHREQMQIVVAEHGDGRGVRALSRRAGREAIRGRG